MTIFEHKIGFKYLLLGVSALVLVSSYGLTKFLAPNSLNPSDSLASVYSSDANLSLIDEVWCFTKSLLNIGELCVYVVDEEIDSIIVQNTPSEPKIVDMVVNKTVATSTSLTNSSPGEKREIITKTEIKQYASEIPPANVFNYYVTNEQVTKPFPDSRQVVAGTVGASREDHRNSTTEKVANYLFYKQTERTHDSNSDAISNLSESFSTDLLTVSGNSTISGTLSVTGNTTSAGNVSATSFSATDASANSAFLGSVSVGTTTTSNKLTVVGDTYMNGSLTVAGALKDSNSATGTNGMILQTTGSGTQWVATSTLGLGGGGSSTFLGLTDTQSSFTANRVLFTNSGGTAVTDSSGLVFDGTNLGIGTTTPSKKLDILAGTEAATRIVGNGPALNTDYTLSVQNNTGDGDVWMEFLNGQAERGAFLGMNGSVSGGALGDAFEIWNWQEGPISMNTGSGGTYHTLTMLTNGRVGIGTDTPANLLDVVGNAATLSVYDDRLPQFTGGGELLLQHTNNSSQRTTYASIKADARDGLVGAEDGNMHLRVMSNGTLSNLVTMVGNDLSVGIGTTTPSQKLSVSGGGLFTGDLTVQGAFKDSNNASGTNGMILQTTGSGTQWVATSTLGVGDGTFLGLTDTISSYTANRLMFANSGATALTDSADLIFDGTNFGLGSTTGIAFGGLRFIYASSTNDSVVFGRNAGESFSSINTYNVAIGYQAGRYASTSNSINNNFIGYEAGYNNSGAEGGNIIGWRAGYNNTGNDNNFIGGLAGFNNTGINNNLFGLSTGYNNTGSENNILGSTAGYSNTGSNNNVFGENAGHSNTGSSNNLMGLNTGYNNTGSENNMFGDAAGGDNLGSYNNFLGSYAGQNNTGNYNEMIGYQAGNYLRSTSSVIVGAEAFYGAAETAFQAVNNTILGYRAGYNATDGADNNVFVGYQAGNNLTTGSNNIVIGYDIDVVSSTGDNQLNIGNLIFGTGIDGTNGTLSSGNIGIGTSSPSLFKLQVAGHVGPDADNLYNLGAAGSDWGCLYYNSGTLGTCASDERLKENIKTQTFDSSESTALDKLSKLTIKTYDFKEAPGNNYTGLIAQEVLEIAPELVNLGEDGYYRVKYGDIQWLNLEATQQLSERTKYLNGLSEVLEESSSAGLLADGEANTFWERLVDLANSFIDGVLNLTSAEINYVRSDLVESENVHVDSELCIGQTCVDETKLRELLELDKVNLDTSSDTSNNEQKPESNNSEDIEQTPDSTDGTDDDTITNEGDDESSEIVLEETEIHKEDTEETGAQELVAEEVVVESEEVAEEDSSEEENEIEVDVEDEPEEVVSEETEEVSTL